MKKIYLILLGVFGVFASCTKSPQVQLVSTTNNNPWVELENISEKTPGLSKISISVNTQNQQQKILGFGGCFNELGWEALELVNPSEKEQLLNDLFNPLTGCKFNLCRIPIGANDYAVDWYSHNETSEDFSMENFSINRDLQRLVPYIKEAQKINPGIGRAHV